MSIRRFAPCALAALAVALAPRTTHALVSVDAFYGIARPPHARLSSGSVFSNPLNIAGGDLILHLGTLEVGAIADHSWKSASASQTALGALVGVGGDLGGALRVEALAELGGHRYGSLTGSNVPSNVVGGPSFEWLAYVGLRPGIALRIPSGAASWIVGLWGFLRWDLTTARAPALLSGSNGSPASSSSFKVGGATIGAVLRVGLDF